jgi:hypothetical protein
MNSMKSSSQQICFAEAKTTSGTRSEDPEGQEATLNALCPNDSELWSFASEEETYNLIFELPVYEFQNLRVQDVPVELQPNYKIRDQLTTDSDGFLVCKDVFVVPKALVQTYSKMSLSLTSFSRLLIS